MVKTCFTQFPQMGIFVKQFSLIFLPFSPMWENWFPHQGILFPYWGNTTVSYWGNTIHQFSHNFPKIPPNSPDFPMIPTDSSVSCAVFNTILCILHVPSKMRIPHYSRPRIRDLGNSGEIQGKSDEKLFIRFHFFSEVRNTSPSWGNLIRGI